MDNMKSMQQDVEDILRNQLDDPKDEEEFQELLDDVTTEGCASGVVSATIYYHDIACFFSVHKDAINKLLARSLVDSGCRSLSEMFGDNWDKMDPLALGDKNQNLLTWFAIEETARTLYVAKA